MTYSSRIAQAILARFLTLRLPTPDAPLCQAGAGRNVLVRKLQKVGTRVVLAQGAGHSGGDAAGAAAGRGARAFAALVPPASF